MKREPSLRHSTFTDASWTASTIALSFTIFAVPGQAKPGPQVDLYGYVAPRCWVATEAGQAPRAICNQSTPRLRTGVRAIDADGRLAERVDTKRRQPQLSGRTALEIVISPQL